MQTIQKVLNSNVSGETVLKVVSFSFIVLTSVIILIDMIINGSNLN